MRYILIDRIICIEYNKKLVALKNISLSEDIFVDHFAGIPVMPGALLIESLAQAGTALLEISNGLSKKALLTMIEHAKFRSIVRPGDQLLVTVHLDSLHDDYAQIDGTVHVGDRLVANAKLVFSLQNVTDFYPLKTRYIVEMLYDIWLKNTNISGFPKNREAEA